MQKLNVLMYAQITLAVGDKLLFTPIEADYRFIITSLHEFFQKREGEECEVLQIGQFERQNMTSDGWVTSVDILVRFTKDGHTDTLPSNLFTLQERPRS